jgi:hypothetical protein
MPRILCAVLMLCLLSGCSSDGLSEGTARKQIESRFANEFAYDFVRLGRVGSHCQMEIDGRKQEEDLSPDKDAGVLVAQMAGYLEVTPDGPGYWQVNLTAKGRNAPNDEAHKYRDYHNNLNGCDYGTYTFAMAHPELVRVKAISRVDDAWVVEFTWKWVTTELGRALQSNGEIYSKLDPQIAAGLKYSIGGHVMKPPVPVPAEELPDHLAFKLGTDGYWNVN